MRGKLRSVWNREANDDRGFTLIELLVVVVIIGVLIAIAVPLYTNYKKGAENTSASSDVRGGISAVEQFYNSNNAYPFTPPRTGAGADVNLMTAAGQPVQGKITVSSGNTVYYTSRTTSYIICGQNSDGKTIYFYDSAVSKSVAKYTGTTQSLTACAV